MELLRQLQGSNSTEVWVAGLVWTIIGITLVKTYYYKRSYKFNLKFWLNDNIKDVGLGVLLSLILLRMGNFAIRIFERAFEWQIGEVEDFIAFMIFVSIFIQYKLHKNRKPISEDVATRMEACNKLNVQNNGEL